MTEQCLYENIKIAANKCEFINTKCGDTHSYINFLNMHYCGFEENLFLTLPALFITSFLCFYLLSDTASNYLSTALTKISEKLKISQNLAGITILAFGNGASDVIGSIVSSDMNEGLEMSLGALLGAGMFITGVVLSSVIYFSPNGTVKVDKLMFSRDILIYLFALFVLIIFSILGKINILMSSLFLGIYLLYLAVAFVQDKLSRIERSKMILDLAEKKEEKLIENNGLEEGVGINEISRKSTSPSVDLNDSIALNNSMEKAIIDEDFFYKEPKERQKKPRKFMFDKTPSAKLSNMLSSNYMIWKYAFKKDYFKVKEFSERNFPSKLFYIFVAIPLTILRDLTIPPTDKEKWNRYFFVFNPILASAFIIIIFGLQSSIFLAPYLYYTLGYSCFLLILTAYIWKNTYRTRIPAYPTCLSIFAFVMSIFWIWCVARVLMDVLESIGTIFGIHKAFLGMTLLALGNSAPDLSINISLAKEGYGEMGIAGSIGGPLFNLLIGYGSALLKVTIERGEVPFTLFTSVTWINLFAGSMLFANLIRIYLQSYLYKFDLRKPVAYFGWCIYIIFIIVICCIVFI
jgi:sodium/potassium/calcium exchanger 6